MMWLRLTKNEKGSETVRLVIFFDSFQAEETRDMVYDVGSSATGINQFIFIKRFVSTGDGNSDNLENREKIL